MPVDGNWRKKTDKNVDWWLTGEDVVLGSSGGGWEVVTMRCVFFFLFIENQAHYLVKSVVAPWTCICMVQIIRWQAEVHV